MSIADIKSAFKGEQDVGKTLRTLAGTAVNIGADMLTASILAAGLCPKKGIKRAVGYFALIVLSMKVGDVAEEFFYEVIDDMKDAFGTAKKELEEAKKEAEKKTDE